MWYDIEKVHEFFRKHQSRKGIYQDRFQAPLSRLLFGLSLVFFEAAVDFWGAFGGIFEIFRIPV